MEIEKLKQAFPKADVHENDNVIHIFQGNREVQVDGIYLRFQCLNPDGSMKGEPAVFNLRNPADLDVMISDAEIIRLISLLLCPQNCGAALASEIIRMLPILDALKAIHFRRRAPLLEAADKLKAALSEFKKAWGDDHPKAMCSTCKACNE